MKMIRAIIRPEKEQEVTLSLERNGFIALTKMDVLGRGTQGGVQVGPSEYKELAKIMLMLVVEDKDVRNAVESIMSAAKTEDFGDGKIFVSTVEEAYTVRTGEKKL